jgi:GT2 family glycosyltransferase
MPKDRFEVVVVDDASRSDMREQCVEFTSRFANLQVVRNDVSRGAAATRNRGASISNGDLLVFLDVDCIAHPEMLSAHQAGQARQSIAACGYTYGRELTPEIWSLQLGNAWNWDSAESLFQMARDETLLQDPLEDILRHAAVTDWAFFWTHNVSVRRADFDAVGGFCADFPVKGVEDMELGLRLRMTGVPTVFLPDARALHQPHVRDRHTDVLRDRHNDMVLLARHPSLEVEIVCSFDIVNARRITADLIDILRHIDARCADCANLTGLHRLSTMIEHADNVLLVGSPGGWPAELRAPDTIVCPFETNSDGNLLTLMGTRLPLGDQCFELAVITDYWRLLPERTACRVIGEVLRCSRRVVMLSGASTSTPGVDSQLATLLESGDRPYWEHTVAVPREFHRFTFTEIDRTGSPHHAAAFETLGRDWPLAHLLDIAGPAPAVSPIDARH